jgi:hypothetical protein
MNQRLSLGIPFGFALILLGVFAYLLRQQSVESSETVAGARQETPPPARDEAPKSALAGSDTPTGSVEEPSRAPSKKRFHGREDGLSRWNLSELPAGWDPELAKSIHNYFETMDEFEAATKAGASGEPIEQARQDLRKYLASLGPEALPTLGAVLDHDPDFVYRRFMYNAIGELGPESEDATYYLRDYFMKRQKDPRNRSEVGNVLKAMEKLQNDSSFEVLRGLIADPSTRPYRDKLIFALGEHNDRAEATPFLVEGLHDSGSTKNRNRYAQALGKIKDAGTLPDLYHAFERERHWTTQQTILGTIGKIGDPNSITFLAEQARHANKGAIRLSAGRALSRIKSAHALDTLRNISETEPDPNVQKLFKKWSSGEE